MCYVLQTERAQLGLDKSYHKRDKTLQLAKADFCCVLLHGCAGKLSA